MKWILFLFLSLTSCWAGSRMAHESQQKLEGSFTQFYFAHSYFPVGEKGLTIKNGIVVPNGDNLDILLKTRGAAIKPGDIIRINKVVVRDRYIHFEINGGPVKHKKWYQRIQVGGANGSMTPLDPSADNQANPEGSIIDLVFDGPVPDLTEEQVKALLAPAIDFQAKSQFDAYLSTIPKKAADAIQEHRVLVGMDAGMVTWAKGKTDNKIREKDDLGEYFEEWIYGVPPADIFFIRFKRNQVVQVEIMHANGDKELQTKPELEVPVEKPVEPPAKIPTLKRPGEQG